MKLSKKTQDEMAANKFHLSCGGGNFGRKFYLEDHNTVVGVSVSNFVKHRGTPNDKFFAQYPNAELTGVVNDFGNERAVSFSPVFKSVQVFSAKQVSRFVSEGF